MDIVKVVSQALPAIKRFEGCRLTAYPDPASGGDPWTVGYGATGHDIKPGTTWTQDQAEADLVQRVETLVTDIAKFVTLPNLPDTSYAALCSFAYNVGEHALEESTLLKCINAGEYQAAAEQFRRWTRAAGKVSQGLVTRREQERSLFLSGFDSP